MKYRKLLAVFLVGIALAGSSTLLAPRPAHAQLIVHDPLNYIENTISALFAGKGLLNPIFYRIAQTTIQSMVRSTVNWINSGFQGSPAYATDIKATLQDAADQEAQRFLGQLRSSLQINSPFRDLIAQKVLNNYYLSSSNDGFVTQNAYTLGQISPDDVALQQGDLTKGGGLSAFIAQAINPQNNWFGAEDLISGQLEKQVGSVREQLNNEVAQGNGFLSWRHCDAQGTQLTDSGGNVGSTPVLSCHNDAQGNPVCTQTGTQQVVAATNLTSHSTCLLSHVETPGSVIANQLNKSLGLGADSLVNAREFDEIVNALLAQLMGQVLGPNGLGGLSSGSTASGGRAYFDQSTGQVTANTSVVSTFTQVLDTQIQSLQSYLASWQTISAAATQAKAAVQGSTCMQDAEKQAAIDAQIQPVINQAAGVIGSTPQALNSLDQLKSQALNAAGSSADTQTNVLQQVSANYQNLLSSNTLPDTSDISYAQAQAQSSGSTLVTKMNQLTAQAHCQ